MKRATVAARWSETSTEVVALPRPTLASTRAGLNPSAEARTSTLPEGTVCTTGQCVGTPRSAPADGEPDAAARLGRAHVEHHPAGGRLADRQTRRRCRARATATAPQAAQGHIRPPRAPRAQGGGPVRGLELPSGVRRRFRSGLRGPGPRRAGAGLALGRRRGAVRERLERRRAAGSTDGARTGGRRHRPGTVGGAARRSAATARARCGRGGSGGGAGQRRSAAEGWGRRDGGGRWSRPPGETGGVIAGLGLGDADRAALGVGLGLRADDGLDARP